MPRARFWVLTIPAARFAALTGHPPPRDLTDRGGSDVVVGCVALRGALDDAASWTARTAELLRMCAHPAIRRAGIATLLLGCLEAWAVSAGYTTLRLTTLAHMAAAVQLYTARGFIPTGSERQAYAETIIEKRHFEKPLSAPPA